ncbi:GNAT family N-acetyltransferase [Corynebacterium sp. Q4381]|uniref:GNAT family N-acetyltransferase n=1 Tax=Corynebacterium sp. Marseille-Q4381 TaxID=3121597 RepID=UPI002FE61DD8
MPALHFVPGAADFNEAVTGAYAFSATLAIQDITGLATSGVTPSHIAKRLEGSAESEALLFALTSRTAPRPLGPLGYPQLTPDDLLDIDAWVFVSLPLLEDLSVLEANVTLDAAIAPLPGEPVPDSPWQEAFLLIDALSHSLHRPTRQLWVTHSPGEWTPPGALERGYAAAFREDQAVFDADAALALPAHPHRIDVFEGPGFAGFTAPATSLSDDAAQFANLLTSASRDYPRGDLVMDTITWDLQRIIDAGERLGDRGGRQLTGVCRARTADGAETIVGLCEAVHYTSDADTVCELGLIYVLPEYRGRGIGEALIRETIAAARARWEKLDTVYLSYPADIAAAQSIAASLHADTVSSTTAWQRRGT